MNADRTYWLGAITALAGAAIVDTFIWHNYGGAITFAFVAVLGVIFAALSSD